MGRKSVLCWRSLVAVVLDVLGVVCAGNALVLVVVVLVVVVLILLVLVVVVVVWWMQGRKTLRWSLR